MSTEQVIEEMQKGAELMALKTLEGQWTGWLVTSNKTDAMALAWEVFCEVYKSAPLEICAHRSNPTGIKYRLE